MTEYELQKLGFSRVYLDENADRIDKPVYSNNIYFFYELEIEKHREESIKLAYEKVFDEGVKHINQLIMSDERFPF